MVKACKIRAFVAPFVVLNAGDGGCERAKNAPVLEDYEEVAEAGIGKLDMIY